MKLDPFVFTRKLLSRQFHHLAKIEIAIEAYMETARRRTLTDRRKWFSGPVARLR